jgi:hypothetical protein
MLIYITFYSKLFLLKVEQSFCQEIRIKKILPPGSLKKIHPRIMAFVFLITPSDFLFKDFPRLFLTKTDFLSYLEQTQTLKGRYIPRKLILTLGEYYYHDK